MKKMLQKSILLLCLSLSTVSCEHDKNSVQPAGSPSTNIPGSGWKISLYTEPGENKTSDYTGYIFEFGANGAMTAVHDGQSTTGTWRQYQDDGVTKFEIALNTADKDLEDLNDDWVIVTKSDSVISLKDDNDSKNEELQFSK